MSWATSAIEALKRGETVTVRPFGNSMSPIIESGHEVALSPVEPGSLRVRDVVLVSVKGTVYLHLIRQISQSGKMFQIGNNKGRVNGWVTAEQIHGRADV